MQFQADVADVAVERPADVESTGRGAAMLAGIGAGPVSRGLAEAAAMPLSVGARFEPTMAAADRAAHLARWKDALGRAGSSPMTLQRRGALPRRRAAVRF